jgi:hypothetical protein
MKALLRSGALLLFAIGAFGQLQTLHLQPSQKVPAVAITITRFGPYPTSIQRPEGPFVLFIANRSGVLDDKFSLVKKPAAGTAADSETAQTLPSLLDLHSTYRKQRDHRVIDPVPGQYQLRFHSHPKWVVNITITSN